MRHARHTSRQNVVEPVDGRENQAEKSSPYHQSGDGDGEEIGAEAGGAKRAEMEKRDRHGGGLSAERKRRELQGGALAKAPLE